MKAPDAVAKNDLIRIYFFVLNPFSFMISSAGANRSSINLCWLINYSWKKEAKRPGQRASRIGSRPIQKDNETNCPSFCRQQAYTGIDGSSSKPFDKRKPHLRRGKEFDDYFLEQCNPGSMLRRWAGIHSRQRSRSSIIQVFTIAAVMGLMTPAAALDAVFGRLSSITRNDKPAFSSTNWEVHKCPAYQKTINFHCAKNKSNAESWTFTCITCTAFRVKRSA